MDERSISGLKLALIDPTIRVRLIEDQAASPNCSILGMWVTNGFLDGQQIRFNDNVSCFIGDTGSGKSVAIELLRFGLNQQARVAKIQKEVESLLKQQLGSLGTVHILLSKGESRYLVERTWGTPAEKPLVQRIMESGSVPIEEMDIRSFFPIKCFSQSEIIEFAREPEVRLSLTDDLIDCFDLNVQPLRSSRPASDKMLLRSVQDKRRSAAYVLSSKHVSACLRQLQNSTEF